MTGDKNSRIRASRFRAVILRSSRALAGVCLSVSLSLPALAQDQFHPILLETAGKGPGEKAVSFKINPAVTTKPAQRLAFTTAPTLKAIADDSFGSDRTRIEDVTRAEGWSQFSLAFGGSGAIGTLAEQVVKFDGLSGINNAMTNLGLFVTVWQVGLDLSRGDNPAAAQNAYKGLSGFAVGKWGWSSLQAASVIWFIVDVTLTTFGNEAWLARTDYWRQVYTYYYRQRDEEARSAELGPRSGYLPPTLEQQVRTIRKRVEGGRSVNEWKVLLTNYYRRATKPDRFSAILEAELDLYVSKFWTSPRFDEYVAEAANGVVGLSKGTSLTDKIRRSLESEHKARLKVMFAKKIFPEIAFEAWKSGLAEQVRRLNKKTVPELNATIDIDVSAYNLTAPARIAVPLPSGGQWTTTLQPDRTRTLKITKLAFIKAGLPEKIILDGANGPVEKTIQFDGDRGLVVFGQPETGMISALTKEETELSCKVTKSSGGGNLSEETSTQPAPPPTVIHTAVTPDLKHFLMGQFRPGTGWTMASPGSPDTSGGMQFAQPYFDGIVAFSACEGGFLTGDILSGSTCKVHRNSLTKRPNGTTAEVRCSSQASFVLKGIFMLTGTSDQYVQMDGPQGDMLRQVLKEGMLKGISRVGAN